MAKIVDHDDMNVSESHKYSMKTTTQKRSNKFCCVPLSDNTQYSLQLECDYNCRVPFHSIEDILEENLDGTVLPSPVQIYRSEDSLLLGRSTLPFVSPENDKANDDDFVVVSGLQLLDDDVLRPDEQANDEEYSITGIKMPTSPSQTICEQESDPAGNEFTVGIEIYQPQQLPNEDVGFEEQPGIYQCACRNHAQYLGDWERRYRQPRNPSQLKSHPNYVALPGGESSIDSGAADTNYSIEQLFQQQPTMQLIDLTNLQNARRRLTHDKACSVNPGIHASQPEAEIDLVTKLRMDTSGRVFHILRSVLFCPIGGSHCVSPWRDSYTSEPETCKYIYTDESKTNNQVFAILLNGHPSDEYNDANPTHTYPNEATSSYFDALEQLELNEFLQFRTGDASPSYYLYSYAALRNGSHMIKTLLQHTQKDFDPTFADCDDYSKNPMTLLIYNRIPPRDCLSFDPPKSIRCQKSPSPLLKGCLWEEFQRSTVPPQSSSLLALSSSMKENRDENDISSKASQTSSSFELLYRIVAPPYQLHTDVYPGLLDHFLTKDNLAELVREAQSIPQWTAWPETNHYQSHNNNSYDNNIEEDDYRPPKPPASWSVFPLCHTFPATSPSNRRWIEMTSSFVPHTTKLLKQIGDPLRTALFSRLEPGTTLGSHRGWADLANHVLRLHIPLVIPSSSFYEDDTNDHSNKSTNHRHRPSTTEGLCGAWVDGCVQTHQEGKILCFDDSKIHRAFNYNLSEERLVLIVDLARPNTIEVEDKLEFPIGTSTGAHTDELDKFIKEFG